MTNLAMVGIYPKCVQCGASIVYGEPHRFTSDVDGAVTVKLVVPGVHH